MKIAAQNWKPHSLLLFLAMQATLLLAPPFVVAGVVSALSALPTHRPLNANKINKPLYLPRLISTPCSSSLFLTPLKSPLKLTTRSPAVLRAAPSGSLPSEDESAKLVQVTKRLLKTSQYFKRLGTLGFWGQLVCTLVSGAILAFSCVIQGRITSPITFYSTAAGIAAAFVSVFWSFGYIRLSERLRRTANEPSKAPPRADVVKSLKNGAVLNLLGMGAAILGMQATVGLLVAKALTTSTVPYYQGISPGQSPVLALDVFLVQACANTILSHFLGLVSSLELLRSVTLPHLEAIPKPAF